MCPIHHESQSSNDQMRRLRQQTHPLCVVCSHANPLGLKIEFSLNPDGSVEGSCLGGPLVQGYDGMMHGGVIAALLDGAMTNCLFAHGHVAVTAELNVRYREAVASRQTVRLRAWLVKSTACLHLLRAELAQNDSLKATATAKFMEKRI
jgi:acyl-coenzyme A thioesterase PaaI-like protein